MRMSLADAGFCVVGDVATREVACVASAITPVPGGVGPMTIAGVNVRRPPRQKLTSAFAAGAVLA